MRTLRKFTQNFMFFRFTRGIYGHYCGFHNKSIYNTTVPMSVRKWLPAWCCRDRTFESELLYKVTDVSIPDRWRKLMLERNRNPSLLHRMSRRFDKGDPVVNVPFSICIVLYISLKRRRSVVVHCQSTDVALSEEKLKLIRLRCITTHVGNYLIARKMYVIALFCNNEVKVRVSSN
jgi:hypothetical protein